LFWLSAEASKNFNASITMRSAETELQNPMELRATASGIGAPKPDLGAKPEKSTILNAFKKEFLKRK
jgi:hypothetical protein